MRVLAEGPVPDPVDLRLLPAVVLTLSACLAIPVVPYRIALAFPWCLLAAAVVSTAVVLYSGRLGQSGRPDRLGQSDRPDRRVLAMLAAVLACACWIAAVAAQQAVDERVPTRATGWEDAVAAGHPLRLYGEASGTAVRREGPFGASWHLTVGVDAFGHPRQALPGGVEVVVSGGAEWDGTDPGEDVCFVARPERDGATVFARAATGPRAGGCGADPAAAGAGQGGRAGNTGRDVVRTAVVRAASDTVGVAPQLLPGLVLGDRSVQEPALDEAMKASGLSHLSAVSGANCTLIAGAVTMALRTLRVRRPVVLGAVLGVLLVFVVIVGWEPSVIRAAVMGALGAWAVFFGRGRQAFPLLCLAACVLLWWQPGLAGEPAFQLSLCATTGIVLAARPVERWLMAVLGRWLPGPVAGAIAAALAVSTTAQVACQPVLVGMTGELSPYAVPANLIAAPLVPLVTVPGTLAAALAAPFPALASAVFWVIGWPAAGIGWIAATVSGWPGALRPWPEGVLGVVLLFGHVAAALALLWLVLRWERSRPARVRVLGPRGRPPRVPPRRIRWALAAAWTSVCAAAGGQLALVVALPAGPLPQDWSLAACDVGQGDMLVLRTGERAAMVVDTGPDPAASRACLRLLAVDRVDLLVLSHLHADHVGGTEAVRDCCRPARVLYSSREDTSVVRSAEEDVGTVAESTVAGERTSVGERMSVGETGRAGDVSATGWQVDWTVLAADRRAASENDASAVLLATVRTPEGAYTVLLTGDLEEEAAAELIQQGQLPERVDVLKVAHHGARNGGRDVIGALEPAVSVVQVGRENGYGHPHAGIVAELGRHGTVVRTDRHGTTVLSLRRGHLVPTVTGARAPEPARGLGTGSDR